MARGLVCIFVLAALSASAFAERRIALIVANSDYETTGWDLANPENDATLMKNALTSVGFEVDVILDATRDQMERAFKSHADRLKAAGPDATGFFFYAGHGVQSEGLNYLVPVDARAYSEADVWAQAPRLENLFRHLRRAGNARNFVVLDACRDNPLLSSARNISGGLASSDYSSGTLIAYSTAPGKVAEDGDTNSPYSTVLASLIKEPGQSVETLFRRVRTRVEVITDYRQRPWTESGLSGDADYCFAGCSLNASLTEDEVTALTQALQSNSISVWREFKARFPESSSRGFADQQIAALSTQTSTIPPGPTGADSRSDRDSQFAKDAKNLSASPSPEADQLFKSSMTHFLSFRYGQATDGFERFIDRFPTDPRIPQAIYWKAEAHYHSDDHAASNTEYSNFIDSFPSHHLAYGAHLGLIRGLQAAGDLVEACKVAERASVNYPDMSQAGKDLLWVEQMFAMCQN